MSSIKEHSSELNQDELVKDKEIGRSDFSVVFSGTYRGRKVAIKEIINCHQTTPQASDSDFDRYIMLMEKSHHGAIVEFIGAVFAAGKQAIVTEFCEYGSLNEAMDEYLEEFNELMKVKCLLDVSSAMCYLHNESIMHRDLKPQNVLIVSMNPRTSAVVAKLTDFGTSRREERIKCVLSTGTGIDPFMAPELLRRSTTYDKSIDVYSFSMLMYYIFAEKLPTADSSLSKGADPYGLIICGKRPSIPATCSRDIGKVMQQCWDGDAMKRPSFEQIHRLLRDYWVLRMYGKDGVAARQNALSLIDTMNLDRAEELIWRIGGRTEFSVLCELLKANAIPTKRLAFKGK